MTDALWLIAYDIADDARRERVSALLAGWGARVQLSVFECEFPDDTTARAVLDEVDRVLDPVDDQVRVYQLAGDQRAHILGRRRLEEREDFWII